MLFVERAEGLHWPDLGISLHSVFCGGGAHLPEVPRLSGGEETWAVGHVGFLYQKSYWIWVSLDRPVHIHQFFASLFVCFFFVCWKEVSQTPGERRALPGQFIFDENSS